MVIVLLEYIDFSLTCSLTGKYFQYTENNYTYYAIIMLDAFMHAQVPIMLKIMLV